jgi:hypothetical protein
MGVEIFDHERDYQKWVKEENNKNKINLKEVVSVVVFNMNLVVTWKYRN